MLLLLLAPSSQRAARAHSLTFALILYFRGFGYRRAKTEFTNTKIGTQENATWHARTRSPLHLYGMPNLSEDKLTVSQIPHAGLLPPPCNGRVQGEKKNLFLKKKPMRRMPRANFLGKSFVITQTLNLVDVGKNSIRVRR